MASAQDPDRAVLTLRFFEDEAAVFTPAEEAVLVNQSIGALRQFETTWRQVKLGLLDPEVLQAFGWDTESAASPAFALHMSQLWPRIAPQMSPDFRSFLEGQFEWK